MSVKRRSGLGPYLIFVAFAFSVFGCATATGPDDTGGGGPMERGGGEPTEARGEGPATPTTMMSMPPEPPGSTLSFGGETVDGGLGAYCWTAGGGGGCVDAFGVVLEEGTLEAPTDATLSFAYGGKALDSLSVVAYRAGREGPGGGREGDVFVMPSKGGGAEELRVRRSGTTARIVADLPAGEYVLNAFARMPEGDASYGFRLAVKEPDAAAGGSPAFATVRFEPALPVDEARRVAEEHGVEGGMIEGQYRVGGEVHTWMWTGGLGADFERERLASFADITSGAGQVAPGGESPTPETSAMRRAVEEGEAGPIEISSIEFYGPEPVLEELIRSEDALVPQASVTTHAEMRKRLRNLPKGCCN